MLRRKAIAHNVDGISRWRFETQINHIINNLNMKNETLQPTETPMVDDRVLAPVIIDY